MCGIIVQLCDFKTIKMDHKMPFETRLVKVKSSQSFDECNKKKLLDKKISHFTLPQWKGSNGRDAI